MTLPIDVRLHERGIRLPEAIGDARREWTERRALLVELDDRAGSIGVGEASPLPGYSPDSFAVTRRALTEWAASEPTLDDGWERPIDTLRRLGGAVDGSSPSARFAVETALLDLLGRRSDRSAASLLGEPATEVPLAVVLPRRESGKVRESALRAIEAGIGTLKLKVGGEDTFAAELRLLEAMRAELGGSVEIRLDANGGFPLDEVSRRLSALAAFRPELIEEPVTGPPLGTLIRSPIPLAADESLKRANSLSELEPITEAGTLAALVLKPMALGGVVRCLELATWAAERGVASYVTHLWDGPIALAAAAHLALVLPSETLACGLVPHAGIAGWPRIDLPIVDGSRLVPTTDAPGLGIDGSALTAAG